MDMARKMNQVKYLTMMICIVIFSAQLCSQVKSDKVLTNVKNDIIPKHRCTLDQAEDAIMNLPEVIDADLRIRIQTNNKHGISLLTDTKSVNDNTYYVFQVGYNGNERFEAYYMLYVNQFNCSNIKILDIMTGDILAIED